MSIRKDIKAIAKLRNLLNSLAIGTLFLCGCDSGPILVPMAGQVKIDGKPLDVGTVTVWIKDYRPSYGAIGKDGRFSLMTHTPGDGCVVGEHTVTVTSQIGSRNDSTQYFIPDRYERPAQSGLTVVVNEPRDDWMIDLTWKGDEHSGPYIVK